MVEIEDLDEFVPFDGVQVAVGQGSHVRCRLSHRPFLPERIAEYVALTCIENKILPFNPLRQKSIKSQYTTTRVA